MGQNAVGFGELAQVLTELTTAGAEVWLAFEPTGPYSSCLREWCLAGGWRLVQVNPYHVKRTREVRDKGPHCSDRKACRIIADLVWGGCYQQVVRLAGPYAQLRLLAGEWASLTKKHTALTNEFGAQLTVWFPELGEIFKDSTCKSVRAVVRGYGSPAQVAATAPAQLRAVLRAATSGRCGRYAEPIRAAAVSSIGVAGGASERRGAMLLLLALLETVEARQEQVCQEMALLLAGLPGLGPVGVAGLLGECGDLGHFASYRQLEKHLGLTLCNQASGLRANRPRISKRGRSLARGLLCYPAAGQCKEGALYHDFAQGLKAKGKTTKEVRVAVARKLLRLLYALARDRAGFDLTRFREAQTGHGQLVHQETLKVA